MEGKIHMTIRELEDYGIIREITIRKKQDEHSICNVSMLIDGNTRDFKFKRLMGARVCIEDENRIIMRGTVREISYNVTYSNLNASFTIISYSDNMDIDKKSRIYQNTKKKNIDIFRVLNSSEGIFQIIDKEFAEMEEPRVICQDKKTDFDFALNFARIHGMGLFVNDTDKKCIINIGKNCAGGRTILDEDKIIFYNLKANEYEEIIYIQTRQFLELGYLVEHNNYIYVVVEAEISCKNNTTKYLYYLKRTIKEEKDIVYTTSQIGRAKVYANNDPDNLGRIQVRFLDIEDILPENRIWIPYIPLLTEKDKGIAFIPDLDEIVHVFMEDGICYADGCIRETALNEKQKDIGKRTIFLRDKKVTISSGTVEMEAFSYKVDIDENSLILSNGETRVIINKDKLSVQCGSSAFNMDKDIIKLISGSIAEVKADKINLDGKNKISAKTSLFDVG